MTLTAEPCSAERLFAELPFTQSWHAIVAHLDSLTGASAVSFLSGDLEDPRTQFVFIYRRQLFRMLSEDRLVAMSVADANCPDHLLAAVLSHFAWLLSPGFGE